jgi:putative membrane protein
MSTTLSGTVSHLADANQLAIDRTRMAYERTLLAWVRTATGLITFGFSIYKFFQLQHPAGAEGASQRLIGAREFAIGAICLGLAALVLATLEHSANLRSLRAQGARIPISLSAIFAALVSLFGIVGLIAAIFRQ